MNIYPIAELMKHGHLSWSTLGVGWAHGWVSEEKVILYARDWLTDHPNTNEDSVIQLAAAEGLPKKSIRLLLCDVTQRLEQFQSDDLPQYTRLMEQWRYAHLVAIQVADILSDNQIDYLQKVYADFGYPEDMKGCCKYGPGPDPLDAMHHTTDRLRTILSQ